MTKFASSSRAAALTGSMRDFRNPPGANLLERVEAFHDWQKARRENGLWPLGRSTEAGPKRLAVARNDDGYRMEGVNFASQDYLSLASHPAVSAAAVQTVEEYGVHSAGSPALVGNTTLSLQLERVIAEFLKTEYVTLFPTGWAAGFGVIKGLVRQNDHIVMDALSHACLQEGAQAATKNISLFRHNSIEDARKKLAAAREKAPDAGILVVTESLFSMDSDTPDIAALQALAHEFGATLMVDVAHDLGCLGEDGTGHIGMQNMLGKVDVVMGSFSKTFGSNGGFVASNSRGVKEYLRYYASPCTFSNALSPIQAAVVLEAFKIISSEEGFGLRKELMTNVRLLRQLLVESGFEVYGDPSAIVSVKVGSEALARLVSRRLPDLGLIANLVEFPAVAKGQARFRMQVMAKHTQHHIVDAVWRLGIAYREALKEYEAVLAGKELPAYTYAIRTEKPSAEVLNIAGKTIADLTPGAMGLAKSA
ncbi:MAG TPA: aminotransferase class I/II-fold pyridoxal phosphate-dependent enzyme [Allosphingosinicella sp.]|uniref:aminotransferase class I/II-fold pyridoxal phosphate-dependent enzyme n=1 Tax=Allosphingosinicella sp. TaxID=2823234 RepID=UPI002ED8E012